jgi:hypothetical protein
MLRDAFVAGIIVLVVGVVLIPVSQLPKSEIRDRNVGKQTLPIPNGETSFGTSLESNTRYHLAIKGELVAPYDPVKIEVLTPDNSSFHIEFPREDPNCDFQILESSGYHNFTFESAYASANTRAEISEIVSWEIITHPYANFLYVGTAFIIVGAAFAVLGLKHSMKSEMSAQLN